MTYIYERDYVFVKSDDSVLVITWIRAFKYRKNVK